MNINILLLGNMGQLGWELNRTLFTLGELTALDYPQINMADPESICALVRKIRPNIVVNATAYTNVDQAERETKLAKAINTIGPGILAAEVAQLGAALIHYSTDYVFDGKKGAPYTEDDQPLPLSVYGETKLAGENAVKERSDAFLIFRTSWVYSLRRPSFVTKVLQWARQNETLRIVDDQVSRPTWARTLAEATAQVIAQGRSDPVDYIKEKQGLYHLTDGGSCSRYAWARAIVDLDPRKDEQAVKEILPAKSDDFPTPAERPLNSTLDLNKAQSVFYLQLPSWQESMCLALEQV
jgi:dTDP-4-dehydrorhamnose reductase